MSSIKSAGLSTDKFTPWLLHESFRSLRLSLVLLVAGAAVSWGATRFSPAFAGYWRSFNYQLSKVALDQHPLALVRGFASRLRESEYGWKPLGFAAPFNVTSARQQLRRDFPEVASVIDGVPQVPRRSALRMADAVNREQRMTAYLARHRQIESGRFTSLYGRSDVFSAPDANAQLALFATKIFGLPDALIRLGVLIFADGAAGVILFVTVLTLSAAPLWRSRRPARTWLKLVVWPLLASTLVWGAIFFMAFASAIFGGLTPDTSGLGLFTALPFLSLLAKIPLHLAETLAKRSPSNWDGMDRRKPPPAGTVPPLGGA